MIFRHSPLGNQAIFRQRQTSGTILKERQLVTLKKGAGNPVFHRVPALLIHSFPYT